ncbi:MAG: 50S ribosomal protein L9 [Pseudomonadales bacterium]|nr:50S ribosomal protein L9 [Pseudomonadales bacterium]
MNVILLEKITNLGDIGETADVKSGFARNFLFPQGKAIPATKANLAEFEERKSELLAAHKENVAAAEARKAKVDGLNIKIEVNASDEGKLYGSVGTKDIADVINSQKDAEIVKSEVLLPHGVIREVGQYEISLDLGHDVSAEIVLAIVAQDAPAGITDDGSLIEDVEAIDDAELEELDLEEDPQNPAADDAEKAE